MARFPSSADYGICSVVSNQQSPKRRLFFLHYTCYRMPSGAQRYRILYKSGTEFNTLSAPLSKHGTENSVPCEQAAAPMHSSSFGYHAVVCVLCAQARPFMRRWMRHCCGSFLWNQISEIAIAVSGVISHINAHTDTALVTVGQSIYVPVRVPIRMQNLRFLSSAVPEILEAESEIWKVGNVTQATPSSDHCCSLPFRMSYPQSACKIWSCYLQPFWGY